MVSRRYPYLLIFSTILLTAAQTGAQDQQLWVGPNVNMVSGTTWPEGDPFLQRQNEPSIAVSTRNTMHLMGFANDYRSVDIPGLPEGKETGDAWLGVFKSFDGGLSWRSTLLPGYPQDTESQSPIHGYDAAADPVVRPGTNGLFYLSGIVFDRGDLARSGVFVSRYLDLNNRESGDPMEHLDTTLVKANLAGDAFIDKPWMAVDVPRGSTQWAQVEVLQDGNNISQDIPCGNVYLAWAEIWGLPPNRRSAIMFTRSTDCGATWDAPIQLSAPDTLNQGVTLAVSPTHGDVWIAWRQFETDPTYLSCAFGGGYWTNHLDEWPLEFIEMGGITYSKAEALTIITTSKGGDATYILAKQLIPAKLNMAYAMAGGELMDLIIAADAWISENPLGSNPKGEAKDEGIFLKDQIEAYNEGLLVAEGCTTSVISPGTGNAIVAARLSSAGTVLSGPAVVAPVSPFEQGTSPISFRTNAYPTITVDDADPDRAYLAWTTRGEASPLSDPIEGDARIVVATSSDGLSWAPPSPVAADNPVLPGHQLKPSITFAGGKVLLTYLDLRLDRSGLFERFIADWPSLESYRHTVDVRVAAADPADQPVFTDYSLTNPPYPEPAVPIQPSDQVSRYVFIPYPADPDSPDPDEVELLQFQYNPPNLPIFVGGTRPFFGDYIDIAPSPPFLPDGQGGWRFNSQAGDGVVFHVAWTDNRDVEAPHDGDWSNYVPPQNPFSGGPSLFDPYQVVPDCSAIPGGEGQTRIRDQNTYTARVSRGLHVASPGSARSADDLQRAFVVFVQNDTQQDRAFRLTLLADPDVNASFEQFAARTELEVEIPGFSSASRTVFVSSDQELPTVEVSVVEIDGLGGWIVTDGLTNTILLNPDPTSPPSADPALDAAEVYTPAMMNPAMMNLAMMNPAMMNLAMMNLAMMNPAMMNPAMMNLAMMNPAMMNLAMMNLAMMNPAMMNPAMMNLAVYNLAMMNPAMMNPAMMNLAMMNPAMMNLAMMNPAMMNASLTDLTWEVRNEGNTAASYSVNMVMDSPPEGFVYELLVYRLYTTPVADGCELTEEAQQQMMVHIIDPDLLSGALLDPGTTDPDLRNATFWVEPGDQVYVTLRVIDPDAYDDEVFDPTELTVATVAQAVNTEDAAAGTTEPSFSMPDISVPTTTGLDDGRSQHTSTMLPDGSILVAGGFNGADGVLATAEIYDPVTRSFEPVPGGMNAARSYHTATVLENGTVLLVGGTTGDPGSGAELYDPDTGTFTATSDPNVMRSGHCATLLADGRVLITGGNQGVAPQSSAEVFDPSTGSFSPVGSMGSARWEHSATLLTTGEVLIAGGYDGLADLDTAELFDPTTEIFSPVPGAMSDPRRFHSATLLPDGTVLLAGGLFDSSLVANSSADIYDPATDSLSPTGSLVFARAAHSATLMADGTVLLAGGQNMISGTMELFSHIEAYDWSTGTFSEKGHLTIPRTEHAAARLTDGKVLITGGTTYSAPMTEGTVSSELYVPAEKAKFKTIGELATGRLYHTVTSLLGGDVLIVGGMDRDSNGIATIEHFSPATGEIATVAAMPEARMFHSATLLDDGTVLIAGGSPDDGATILDTALIYDPSDHSVSYTTGPLGTARYAHAAILLQDGRVLIVAGTGPGGRLASTEIFDPSTGTFSPSDSLATARATGGASELLDDGRVLIAGGRTTWAGVTAAFQLWDPATETFGPEGTMIQQRRSHRSTLLADGTVLVAGGTDGSTWLDTAEIFDPVTETFSAIGGTMKLRRASQAQVLLPTGQVLLAGGITAGSILVSYAELYDPITQTFRLTHVLDAAHSGTRPTRLADGRVLIVGGMSFYGPMGLVSSAEVETYNPWDMNSGGKAVFTSQPKSVPIGGLVAPRVQVAVFDRSFTPITSAQVSLRLEDAFGGAGTTWEAWTNGNGVATFDDVWFDRIGPGRRLIAEAVTPDGLLSTDPSVPFEVLPLVVTNTHDDGPGSLRRAIENAERNLMNPDTISFNIAGTTPHVVSVLSPLPPIWDSVTIDATGEPDYAGSPVVHIDGAGAGVNARGLMIRAADSEVEGLAIVNFSGVGVYLENEPNMRIQNNYIGTDGINDLGNAIGITANNCADLVITGNVISGNDGPGMRLGEAVTGAVVADNKIGTNATGEVAIANSAYGIWIIQPDTYDNTISNNLISGNSLDGVLLWNGTHDNIITGNIIGLNIDRDERMPNGIGVRIEWNAANNMVGGTEPGDGNTIAGNANEGIYVNDTPSSNTIQGNWIGTNPTGDPGLGNAMGGVSIRVADGTEIGGPAAGAGNTIANNGGAGVEVISGTGNTIFSNSIFDNALLGIDLGGDGVTPNDSGDGDSGPNGLVNFPVLTSASDNGTNTTIVGSVDVTVVDGQYLVYFFSSDTCDPSGYGEGQNEVFDIGVTSDTPGTIDFVLGEAPTGLAGKFLTATVTSLPESQSTSEFSNCVEVVTSSFPSQQRAALIALYNSTGGPSWTDNTNWLGAPGTECTWYGVTCDGGGTNVTRIDLTGNNLNGSLPISIGDFPALELLDLVFNPNLTGPIPASIGNLAALQTLDAYDGSLSGPIPAEIGNLSNLEYLELSQNQLDGAIPPEIGNLSSLTSLVLTGNQLTGTIPSALGNLSNLRSLSLSGNLLTGTIPVELGNLANLLFLNLSGNHLNGSIPSELGSLANLESLYLAGNQLTGNIPTELANLSNLRSLYLGGNQLNGSIPSVLGNLTNLRTLSLPSNQLTGAIPSELGNVSNLRSLDLRYNQLSGTIPSELGDLLNLWSLDLRSNELTGTLPTALGDLANLRDLLLNGNQLSGTIPPELGDLLNLQTLYLAGNQLSGTIPPELGDLLNLQTLYLAGNQLTGTIPTELGNLANLVSLYLGHNQLTGAIPSELGNLSNLQYLDLHGNQLAGVVPSTLVNLVNLQWAGGLEIGWNALHTTDPVLISFLDAKQGGDWQSTQTVAPTGLVPSSPTSSSINLSWTPITYTGDTGGYEARYATSPGGPYTDFVPPTSDKSVTSMTVNGLSADTTYHFVVRTFTNPHTNNSGTVVSENSLEVTLATLP